MLLPTRAQKTRKANRLARYLTFTPTAETRLAEIALWTIEHFGPLQADQYATALLARCTAILEGHVHLRAVSTFSEGFPDTELMIAKAESHYIVFAQLGDECVVFDFLHERSDLPSQLQKLIETYGQPD